MVKFVVTNTKDGLPLIGFGISEKNVEMLKEGKPILVKGSEIETPINFMIFYGKDNKEMYRDIEKYIGPETEIKEEK